MKKSTLMMTVMALMMLMVREAVAQECWSDVDLSVCAAATEEDVQPVEECCANLQEYTSAGPPEVCLCGGLSYVTISDYDNEKFNLWYALQIPVKCNLHFPAGTTCMGYEVPGGH